MRSIYAVWMSLMLGAVVLGESKPDFSGTWKLNVEESRYVNKDSVPTMLTRVVEQNGDTLTCRLERELKGKTASSDYTVTIGSADADAPVSAEWKGSVLVVTITKQGVKQIENWQMANGGKQVRDETTIQQPGKEAVTILRVFDKQ